MAARFARKLVMGALANGMAIDIARRRLSNDHAVVLMYHEVVDDAADIESWTALRVGDLARQLEYLERHYDIVSMDDALARLRRPGTARRPAADVTFDDGGKGNATTLLPLVESVKLPVTIYVATGHVETQQPYWFDRLINALQVESAFSVDLRRFAGLGTYAFNRVRGGDNWLEYDRLLSGIKALPPERYDDIVASIEAQTAGHAPRRGPRLVPMTVADVQAVARSPHVTIGGHSHCHTLQTRLSPAARQASLETNRRLLREWTGQPVQHFAYPSGDLDAAVVADVKACGYVSAVSTEHEVWRPGCDEFRIPRFGIGRYDALPTFRAGLVGGPRRLVSLLLDPRTRSPKEARAA
jgi:peptidoglycan/xylan/chitin deacetylase (PgdA/CDA1 family)